MNVSKLFVLSMGLCASIASAEYGHLAISITTLLSHNEVGSLQNDFLTVSIGACSMRVPLDLSVAAQMFEHPEHTLKVTVVYIGNKKMVIRVEVKNDAGEWEVRQPLKVVKNKAGAWEITSHHWIGHSRVCEYVWTKLNNKRFSEHVKTVSNRAFGRHGLIFSVTNHSVQNALLTVSIGACLMQVPLDHLKVEPIFVHPEQTFKIKAKHMEHERLGIRVEVKNEAGEWEGCDWIGQKKEVGWEMDRDNALEGCWQ